MVPLGNRVWLLKGKDCDVLAPLVIARSLLFGTYSPEDGLCAPWEFNTVLLLR
jgi:hypothetical protein